MLSQLAWKIGRAFTAGRKGAPAEFLDVETAINGLAKALKLLAETLFAEADDSVLAKADSETKSGVATILLSCQRTLQDLDSLMDQYQVIKKHRTSGGFTIERSWSDLVLSNYQSMMWTTEGGDVQTLRNMVNMHTSTVALTMQALQSKSLSRLESTVTPMAEKIDDIRDTSGDLNGKLEEVHRVVVGINGETPRIPPVRDGDSRPSSSLHLDTRQQNNRSPESFKPREVFQQRQNSRSPESFPPRDVFPQRQSSRANPPLTPEIAASGPSSATSSIHRISGFSFGGSQGYHSGSYAGSEAGSSNGYTSPIGGRSPMADRWHSKREPTLVKTPELEEPRESQTTIRLPPNMPPLPPPAMDIQPDPGIRPVMPLQNLRLVPPSAPEVVMLHRSSTTASQQEAFERGAFRNSAILCDLRGGLVEYTHTVETEEDPYGVEMVQATAECRICVVRKRETMQDRSIRMVTSIWAFSDDNTVRFQQKLADGELYVPYSSYFSPEKISVTVPTEVRFYGIRYGTKPTKVQKTSWINYVFADVKSAALFQNELMGRTLLGTYKTEKTLRIHEGLSGVLAYQEQMCGMENLRLWEDESTNAVIATIHFSAHFRNGYLAFYLNSSANPVRVKDEGGREVKIKGLRVLLDGKADGKGLVRKDSGAGVLEKAATTTDRKSVV